MKKRVISTQEQLDGILCVKKDEAVYIRAESSLTLNAELTVFGTLEVATPLTCSSKIIAKKNSSVVARGNSSVVARDNSSVEAWGNSSVVAWESSSVVARGNSSVVAWDNSSVVAWESSSVVARDNSSVVAWDNSSVEAWGNSSVIAKKNSSVVARGNSSVVARDNSSVVAWDNSSVEAWDSAVVRAISGRPNIVLHCFCVLIISSECDELKYTAAKTVAIQKIKPLPYLERNGVVVKNGHVILYKRVSKDFKTMENTEHETLWTIGSTLTHHAWNPTKQECGSGKFHACHRPYFCNEFRSTAGDRYVAIKVNIKDLHEWENPSYPHKIAFRKGKVLYECDRFGKRVDNENPDRLRI